MSNFICGKSANANEDSIDKTSEKDVQQCALREKTAQGTKGRVLQRKRCAEATATSQKPPHIGTCEKMREGFVRGPFTPPILIMTGRHFLFSDISSWSQDFFYFALNLRS